jgi:hypothetical protein
MRFSLRDPTQLPGACLARPQNVCTTTRRTAYSRGLIRKILRGQWSDVFRIRKSSLEPNLPWLDEQWETGHRNGAALWRALRLRGFRGCLGVVSECSARRKRAEKTDPAALGRAPSARTVAHLLTVGRGPRTPVQGIIRRPGRLDQQGSQQPCRRIRQRRVQRQSCDRGGDRFAVVQRADRRPDMQTEARQTSDIRSRKPRSPSGPRHGPRISGAFIESASDALFHEKEHAFTAPSLWLRKASLRASTWLHSVHSALRALRIRANALRRLVSEPQAGRLKPFPMAKNSTFVTDISEALFSENLGLSAPAAADRFGRTASARKSKPNAAAKSDDEAQADFS